MRHKRILKEFTKSFYANDNKHSGGIGIECEVPVVTQTGESVPYDIIEGMYAYLAAKGFKLRKDVFSNHAIAATRENKNSATKFDYHIDTIKTEVGFSTLEIALAPADDLHSLRANWAQTLAVLVPYFASRSCRMLGYGIHPVASPSRKLLTPKERYLFYERFSPNYVIPKSEGVDAHLLTITASSQCHVDVSSQEAIQAANVLNALSGLQLILHANSPIWKAAIDGNVKANREFFWQFCYPDRLNQKGIPPKFAAIEDYFQYLLAFKPLLVRRDNQLLQVLNKVTFEDFLRDETPTQGDSLSGETWVIQPEVEDIFLHSACAYFNARLVPKHGTVENRICCQQPPNETLTPAALTLGILENLAEAAELMESLPWGTWKNIRREAIKKAFDAQVEGVDITFLLSRLLHLAQRRLQKRALGEEIFLQPLYKRLETRKSPADVAIEIFKTQGLEGLLSHYTFVAEKSHKDTLVKAHDGLA